MSHNRNLRNARRSLPENLQELARGEEDDNIIRFDEMYHANARGARGGRGRGRSGRGGRGNYRGAQVHNYDEREPLVPNNHAHEPLVIEEIGNDIPNNQIPNNINEGDLQDTADNGGRHQENNVENAQGAENEQGVQNNNGVQQNDQREVNQGNAENDHNGIGTRAARMPDEVNPQNNRAGLNNDPQRLLNQVNIPRADRRNAAGPYNYPNFYTKKNNTYKDSRIYSLEKVLKDKTDASKENSNPSAYCSAKPVAIPTASTFQHSILPPAAIMPLHYLPVMPAAPPFMPAPTIPASNFASMPMAHMPWAPSMPMAHMLAPTMLMAHMPSAIATYESKPMAQMHAMMGGMQPYNRVQQLQPYPILQPPNYYGYPPFY